MRLLLRTRAPPRHTPQTAQCGVTPGGRSRQHTTALTDRVLMTLVCIASSRCAIAVEPGISAMALAARTRCCDDGGHVALVGKQASGHGLGEAAVHHVVEADSGPVGEGDVVGGERDRIGDTQSGEVAVFDTGHFGPLGVFFFCVWHLLVF